MQHLGLARVLLGQDRQAEEAFQESARLLEALVKEMGNAPDHQSVYAPTLSNLALARAERKEWKKADRFFAEAVLWQQKAWRASGSPLYRVRLRGEFHARCEVLAEQKDPAALAGVARQWHEALGADWRDCYGAAAVLARCASMAEKPDAFAEEAVKLLAEARVKGLRDPDLVRGPAFAPLRPREDYRALVAALEEGEKR